VTLSSGNLAVTCASTSATQGAHVAAINGKTSGKYYFEITRTAILSTAASSYCAGVGTTSSAYGAAGISGGTTGVVTSLGGNILTMGASSGKTIPSADVGSVIGVSVDLDNRKIWFKKLTGASAPSGWNEAGTSNGYDPVTNVGGVVIPAGTIVPFVTFGGIGTTVGDIQTANFGASAFVGAVPCGFMAGWPA